MAYVAALSLPFTREFFALALPTAAIVLSALGGAAIAIGGLWLMGFPPRAGVSRR